MRVHGLFKIFIISLFLMIISQPLKAAADSQLLGIDIKKNASGGADIVLKLDGNADIKKSSVSQDNLNIIIKGAEISDYAETAYDNASDIDNIIIQKKNSSGAVISVQGRDVSKADVYIKNSSSEYLLPDKTGFSSFNNKAAFISAAALFFIMLMMSSSSRRKKAEAAKLHKRLQNMRKNARTASYRQEKTDICVSSPFVINRYMENERLKKAG